MWEAVPSKMCSLRFKKETSHHLVQPKMPTNILVFLYPELLRILVAGTYMYMYVIEKDTTCIPELLCHDKIIPNKIQIHLDS